MTDNPQQSTARTSKNQLPEYSAEVLAANYPNRKDHTILSGPYTPAYLANAEIERLTRELEHWKKTAVGEGSNVQAVLEINRRLRAALEHLSHNPGTWWSDYAREALRGADETSPVLDHRYLPDSMDPGICAKCGSTRASHRDKGETADGA